MSCRIEKVDAADRKIRHYKVNIHIWEQSSLADPVRVSKCRNKYNININTIGFFSEIYPLIYFDECGLPVQKSRFVAVVIFFLQGGRSILYKIVHLMFMNAPRSYFYLAVVKIKIKVSTADWKMVTRRKKDFLLKWKLNHISRPAFPQKKHRPMG